MSAPTLAELAALGRAEQARQAAIADADAAQARREQAAVLRAAKAADERRRERWAVPAPTGEELDALLDEAFGPAPKAGAA